MISNFSMAFSMILWCQERHNASMQSSDRPPFFSSWDLLALAAFTALGFFYVGILPGLPDPVPTHYNALGRVDGWTPKDQLHWIIFGLPVFIWFLLFAVGSLLSIAQKNSAKAKVAMVQPMRGCLSVGFSILMATCLLIPRHGLPALWTGVGFLIASLLCAIVFSSKEMKELLAGAPDASFYRWGMFYVNPQDPRIWVDKRLGVGKTLNYAHPAAYWITLLLILPAIIVLAVVFNLNH
jgi:uncharacterized membrane protein